MEKFADRHEAGEILATYLKAYKNKPDTIILALPRGGVPVAYEIAKALSLPLDVFVVRKLGVPGHEELALGAIATGGTVVFNENIVRDLHISDEAIQQVIESEQQELTRRETIYRGTQPSPILKDKTIILVDDGIATGATTRAAIKALHKQKPQCLLLAVPVAAHPTYLEISEEVDEMICPLKPTNFHAVGLWYEDFSQTMEREVAELLEQAKHFYVSLH